MGTASGSVSSDSNTPPRRAPSVRPGADRADQAHGETAERQRGHDAAHGVHRHAEAPAAAIGADSASGSPVSSQCVQVFANNIHVSDWPDNANCSSVPSYRVIAKQELERQQRG